MDIVERARADVMRSGTWADTGNLILEMAEEIERLRADYKRIDSYAKEYFDKLQGWIKAYEKDLPAAVAAEREAISSALFVILESAEEEVARAKGYSGDPDCLSHIQQASILIDSALAAIRNRSQP
jgi:hypothetical protein